MSDDSLDDECLDASGDLVDTSGDISDSGGLSECSSTSTADELGAEDEEPALAIEGEEEGKDGEG